MPLLSKSWDGNVATTQVFQERATARLTAFAQAPTPHISLHERQSDYVCLT